MFTRLQHNRLDLGLVFGPTPTEGRCTYTDTSHKTENLRVLDSEISKAGDSPAIFVDLLSFQFSR